MPRLYELIAAWDGSTPLELPEEGEHSGPRLVSGARDGIATHHMASLGEADEARQVYGVANGLRRLVGGGGDDSWLEFVTLAGAEQVVRYADALGSELARMGDLTEPRVAPHARRLVREATKCEALKLGILLLGLYGDKSDLEMLLTVGRHEEFTLFTALAVARLVPDPLPVWWRMARGLNGWGKVHLVERICDMLEESEESYDEIRAWLLREGCSNEVLPEYVACRCAIGGALHTTLTVSDPDDALLDGASIIVEALMNDEGPSEDMSDYEHGVRVVTSLLAHLEKRCDSVHRLSTVIRIREWNATFDQGTESRRARLESLGWSSACRAALDATCATIIEHDRWKRIVQEAYESDDFTQRRLAWSAAEAVGVDLWDSAFRKLEQSPLDEVLYFELFQTDDAYRQRRLIAFAERNLPLDEIACGPSLELGLGDAWRAHGCLAFALQALCCPELFSPTLVSAGLRSPVTGVRNAAVSVLESHPAGRWKADLAEVLEVSLRTEPSEALRDRLRALWRLGA